MDSQRTVDRKLRWLLGAGLVASAAALPWATAQSPSLPANKTDALEAPDEILPLGRECVVLLAHANGETQLGGRLDRANSRWLGLSVDRAGTEEGVPLLEKIPHVERLFKKPGTAARHEEYWIPRERVVYVRVADEPSASSSVSDSEGAAASPTAE